MPVFTIDAPNGDTYEIEAPNGASKEQAFEFFKREHSAGRVKPKAKGAAKQEAPTEQAPKRSTTWDEDIRLGLTNAITTAGKAAGGVGIAALDAFGNEKGAEDLYATLQRGEKNLRKWANPEEAQQGFGGKLLGAAATLPAQVLAMPFSPANTGQEFLQEGESLPRAAAAAGIDLGTNIAGLALGGQVDKFIPKSTLIKKGTNLLGQGAANAVPDYYSKAAIQSVAENEGTKKKFEPSIEDALVSGVTGVGMGTLPTAKSKPNLKKVDELRAAREEAAKAPVTPPTEQTIYTDANGVSRNAPPDAGELLARQQQAEAQYAKSVDQIGQMNSDPNAQGYLDFNDFGNNDPMARMPNMRIDENGMPIRADLSMEAQNLENPLQMNMWGDELGPALDQTRSLTEAIDSMPPGAERDRGIEMLSGVPKPSSGPRGQRGAIDPDFLFTLGTAGLYPVVKGVVGSKAFKEGFVRANKALSKLTDQPWLKEKFPATDYMANPDGTPAVLLHGTTANFDGSPRAMDEGFHAGHASSPHMFAGGAKRDADGMLMPKAHESLIDYTKGTGGRARSGKIYPVAIKRGNYPEIGLDFNNWSAENLLGNKGFRNALARLTGKDQSDVGATMDRYSENLHRLASDSFPDINTKNSVFSKMLKDEFGIDGFTYKNEVESTKSALAMSTQTRFRSKAKHYGDTPSFVTWDNNNFQSIYKDPASPQGRPLAPRSQLGGQTMFTDLGLGVYNVVSKGRKALNSTGPKNLLGKDMIPEDVPVETILANAAKETDSKSWNSLEAGNAMRAAKSRSTWVRDTWDYAQNAIKRSEVNVRNYVTGFDGAERATRGLSKQERLELAATMKDEMLSRQQYTPEQMAAAGFTTKQLEAYAKIREMQAAALEALNYGRRAQGKPEVTPQEAYLTSAWQGEIKMRVLDAEGKLAYYLSGNSERQVKKQMEALKKEHPEFVAGPVERIKQSFNGRDVQTAYSIMADAVGRDSEAFKKIQEWYTQYQATQAHSAMGTEKHFETKANIRGFVGDRPGADPHAEATALLQSQMNFAKESFHWAALQDAATKMAPIFQNENIRDYHPNNLAYLQEQFRIAAGVNEGAFARGVNDGVRALGFTPAQVFGVAQTAKSWFMFQKLAFNLGYGAANMLQLPYTMPHLLDIGQKFGAFNPARSIAVASALTVPMFGAHYGRQYAGIDLVKGVKGENFYREMFDYAEQNGVTSRSIVDEAPLDAGVIGRAGNLTTSSPETVIRSFAFTLFADSLKQTGKMNNIEVFKEAERRTNIALGDFRETERAPVFSRLGNVGNVLNTLQTYGVNYYQQMSYFLRESLRGNVAPLAAMLAVQYGLAGISGMPGMQDLEKGWEQVKGVLPNSVWAKVGDFDPRIWAYEHFGATGVDGVASTVSGVSLNSRVSAPAGSEMVQAPGGPLIEAAKQIGSVASLAMNPTDPTQQAETAMKLLPSGFTGALETGPFRDQTSVPVGDKRSYFKTNDLHKRDSGYKRTPEQEELRKYGFRSTAEVRERDLSWKMNSLKSETTKRKPGFVDDYYYAVISGNTKKAEAIASDYVKVYGKEIMDDQLKRQIEQTYLTDLERTKASADKLTPKELIRLRSIRQILETAK